jgi:hypothetical protein
MSHDDEKNDPLQREIEHHEKIKLRRAISRQRRKENRKHSQQSKASNRKSLRYQGLSVPGQPKARGRQR